MSISTVNAQTTQSSSTTKTTKPNSVLGKDDFLQLLVTQLRYQDPTKPMSNEQFIAQTAQFSALEQMQELNSSINSLLELQKTDSKTSALALIGKKVTAETSANSSFTLSDQSSASLDFSLPQDASVTIAIYDTNQNVVKNADLGKQLKGSYSFSWDGTNNDGIRMSNGNYSYKISAKDANGQNLSINNPVSGIVDGVSIDGSQTLLNMGDSSFPLSAVTKILLNSTEG